MDAWAGLHEALTEHARTQARVVSPPVQKGKVRKSDPLTVELEDDDVIQDGEEDVHVDAGLKENPPPVGSFVQVHTNADGDHLVIGVPIGLVPGGGGGGGGAPSGPAGGVLSGTYPNPGFAVDMATQAELDAEAAARVTADGLKADLTDARFPTANEKAALAGTSGAPSVANKYVTDADSRLKNLRAFAMAVSG